MLCSTWDKVFTDKLKHCLRMLEPQCAEFYDHQKKDLLDTMMLLNQFDNDIYEYKREGKQKFSIRYREFESLCKKYMIKCKETNNHTGGYIFYSILDLLRPEFKVEGAKFTYNWAKNFRSPATEDEKKRAAKSINKNNDKNFDPEQIEIMKFRGFKFYVYNDYAYYPKYNKIFSLEWDWWFNIEKWIFLKYGWDRII